MTEKALEKLQRLEYYSQCGQDRFLLERYFTGRRGGTFVDIGAYDGVTFSNTYYLEKYLGWKGLCIEPLPSAFEVLQKIRTSKCLQVAVSDFEGEEDFLQVESSLAHEEKMLSGLKRSYSVEHLGRIDRTATSTQELKVRVRKINDILGENQVEQIDYLSIDVEGAELPILRSLDFERFTPKIISVENNEQESSPRELLQGHGYRLEQCFHGYDDLYVREDLTPRPVTTVICAAGAGVEVSAVEAFVAHHRETLGETPLLVACSSPISSAPGAPVRQVPVASDATWAEACNAALGFVTTPLHLAFTPSDRLFQDGLSLLEKKLYDHNADLTIADWLVPRDDHKETSRSIPIDQLPPLDRNAPEPQHSVRVGSGDDNSLELGAACLMRTEVFPRIPHRVRCGTLLSLAGTAYWRSIAGETDLNSIPRTPWVVGSSELCKELFEEITDKPLLSWRLVEREVQEQKFQKQIQRNWQNHSLLEKIILALGMQREAQAMPQEVLNHIKGLCEDAHSLKETLRHNERLHNRLRRRLEELRRMRSQHRALVHERTALEKSVREQSLLCQTLRSELEGVVESTWVRAGKALRTMRLPEGHR